MDEEADELTQVAFQVILNAGDARNCLDKAIDHVANLDFDAAAESMEEADALITKAHNAQTGIIQRQAAGEKFEYSILFVHAQDTLMTIDAQIHLFKKLVPVFKTLSSSTKVD